jgi:hypothetical protein
MAGPQGNNVPVWVTVGFALGLGFGWWAFHADPAKPVALAAAIPAPAGFREPTAGLRQDAGTLGEVEQVFERWGGYSVWANDVTEIALWRTQHQRHDDFYEVRRVGGVFYFRALDRLTRPVIDHGTRGRLPLEFTETKAMHDDFHRAHPDYNPLADPLVDLPPRPPERFERHGSSPQPTPEVLTPGAGG